MKRQTSQLHHHPSVLEIFHSRLVGTTCCIYNHIYQDAASGQNPLPLLVLVSLILVFRDIHTLASHAFLVFSSLGTQFFK